MDRPNIAILDPAFAQFQGRDLRLHGHRLHYLDEGQGEPVLLVHGNPTWSFFFRGLVSGLRDQYRLIVPDHIGCGFSDKPPDSQYRYTLESRVNNLEQLMDHLAIRQPITLGVHDWGGMIGCAWALRHPERIARIIVFNTGAFLKPPGKLMPLRLSLIRNLPWLGAFAVQGFNAFAYWATYLAVAKPMPPKVRGDYLAPYNSWRNRIATLRFVQDIPLKPGDPSWELAKWTDENLHLLADKPMLICWGAQDWVFDRHFLAEWRRRFPQAQVHTFPNAGHYVLEDAGAEILPMVREFLGHG